MDYHNFLNQLSMSIYSDWKKHYSIRHLPGLLGPIAPRKETSDDTYIK